MNLKLLDIPYIGIYHLDDLLTYSDEKEIHKLTKIKSLNHSIKPKAIRKNIDEFNRIRNIYNQHVSLIKSLPLSSKGVEYFATTVIKSDIFRVKRKSDNDRYLHLITFIIYQYSIIHDALMDIFLKAIGSFNSSSKREHQLRCYEERVRFQVDLSKYIKDEILSPIVHAVKDHASTVVGLAAAGGMALGTQGDLRERAKYSGIGFLCGYAVIELVKAMAGMNSNYPA